MKLLIIDDDFSEYHKIKEKIELEGIQCTHISTPLLAVEYLKSEEYDLCFLDFNLAVVNAEKIIGWLKEIRPSLNTDVYVVSNGDIDDIRNRLSKFNSWYKGCFSKKELYKILNTILHKYLHESKLKGE